MVRHIRKKSLCVPALLVIVIITGIQIFGFFKRPSSDYSITITSQSTVTPEGSQNPIGDQLSPNTAKSVTGEVHRSSTVTDRSIPPTDYTMHIVTYYHSLTLRNRKTQGDEDKQNSKAAFLQRVQEELFALQKNLNHSHVEMVHLLAENGTTLSNILRKEGLGSWMWKIHIHEIGREPKMKDAFQYISDNLVNETVMFANGDIYLGKGFDKINVTEMGKQKIMYALTRHNSPEGNCTTNAAACNKPYVGSHDAFMINLVEQINETVFEEIDYEMATWGSENRLMWAFKTIMNFCLLNPCSTLETFHYHCSKTRPERIRVNIDGKSALVPPTTRLTCD